MTVRILPRALTAVRRGVVAGVMGLAFGACTKPDAKYANRIGVVIDPEGLIKEFEPIFSAWLKKLIFSIPYNKVAKII